MNEVDSLTRHTSAILKYLRIANDMTQSDMGQVVDCSRFKVARMEKGELQPTFYEWWKLVSHFKIDHESFLSGVISVTSPNDMSAFDVKKPYSENAYSGGRTLQMHLKNFKHILGDRALVDLCKKEKIDPLFFVNINNSLNMNFNLRLIQILSMKNLINTEEVLREYAKRTQSLKTHHFNTESFFDNLNGIERIRAFHEISEMYEKNHEYVTLDYSDQKRSIVCAFRPKEHVDFGLYDGAFVKGFFCRFINLYYQTLSNRPLAVKKFSCYHSGEKYCTYQYFELGASHA